MLESTCLRSTPRSNARGRPWAWLRPGPPRCSRTGSSATRRAIERADVEALVALVADDVVLEMPPVPAWSRGRRQYREFMESPVLAGAAPSGRPGRSAANGQPAALALPTYRGERVPHTLQLFDSDCSGASTTCSSTGPAAVLPVREVYRCATDESGPSRSYEQVTTQDTCEGPAPHGTAHRHSVHHPRRRRRGPGRHDHTDFGGWAMRHGPQGVAGDKFRLGPILRHGTLLFGRRTWEHFSTLWPTRETRSPRR